MNTNNAQTQRPIMKKQVSFRNDQQLNEIQEIEKFDNPQDLWFSRLEETAFKDRDYKLKTLLRHLAPSDLECQIPQESCRGLEYSSSDQTYRQIELRRRSTKIAVLSTQSKCQDFEPNSQVQTRIARAYGMVSKTATQYAIDIAESDQEYVNENIRRNVVSTNLYSLEKVDDANEQTFEIMWCPKTLEKKYYTTTRSSASSCGARSFVDVSRNSAHLRTPKTRTA